MILEGQAAKYFRSQNCNLYAVGELTDSYYAFAFAKGNYDADHAI